MVVEESNITTLLSTNNVKRFMKFYNLWRQLLLSLFVLALVSCTETEIDEEKPTITVNYAGGFPQTCEDLSRGQSYTIKAKVTDNLELASYSIEMHHNFDHHTHDDQEGACQLSLLLLQ